MTMVRKPTEAELAAETEALDRWLKHLVEHPHRPYHAPIFPRAKRS